MTNAEAIETLRVNYPDACYEQLREAVDAAIEALKAQDAAGDTISRQAAIDAVGYYSCYSGDKLLFADKPLKALPSAESEIIQCKDCKYWKDIDGVYKRGFDAESKCPLNLGEVYEGTFYCGRAERKDNG